MVTGWAHVGRLWTNGEPYLALDSVLVPMWRGFTDDTYNTDVVPLPYTETTVRVAGSTAVIVGVDGVVGDEGWLEVFTSGTGQVAIVQAAGAMPYDELLRACLAHPDDADDLEGGVFEADTGHLVLLNAALDGTGEYSGEIVPAKPGPIPTDPAVSADADPAGLILDVDPGTFALTARWYTALDEDNRFARWTIRRTAT